MWYGWYGLLVVPTAQNEGVSERSGMYGAKKEEAVSCLRPSKSRAMNWTGHVACIGIKKYSLNVSLGS